MLQNSFILYRYIHVINALPLKQRQEVERSMDHHSEIFLGQSNFCHPLIRNITNFDKGTPVTQIYGSLLMK